jgi:Flp pilus assembly protein protease CpaA
MVVDIILLTIALIALVIASGTDIKTREVPDWFNFSLIFIGLGLRLIYSSITFDWIYSLEGALGLIVAVVIGFIMFYAGQWGGGDSKLLMGLGALVGLGLAFEPIPMFLILIINIILVGSLYGLVYIMVKAATHWTDFIKQFKTYFKSDKRMNLHKYFAFVSLALLAVTILITKDFVVRLLILILVILLYLSVYAYFFVKSVEKVAMLKLVNPSELTEGDWIAKDIFVNKRKIAGPKDLGVSREQIKKLVGYYKKRKINKVLMKVGIPFVPSFLIAFILTLLFKAWWMFLF